ncbi:MAG: GntP family permease [Bacteroidota bacterium]
MTILMLLLSVGIIILMTTRFEIHPFLALLVAALVFGLGTGMSPEQIITGINSGFGGIMGNIGLVIVLGVIMGAFLEYSGGAYKLAEFILRIIGKKRVHEAMGMAGWLVSIPVFVDSGFIILTPLNKSITKRAGLSLAGTGVALILGLMLTHVMVPPTPGPIAAAGYIGADIGTVMWMGMGVSLLALVVAILYAKFYASRVYIDPAPEVSEEEMQEKLKQAPSTFFAFLPILIPILLIVSRSIVEFQIGKDNLPEAVWWNVLNFVGTPVIALMVGTLLAIFLPKKLDKSLFSTTGLVGKAMKDSATILLITGAGGIFGAMLKQSDLAQVMSQYFEGINLGIWLPFLLAATIKTAQGSSTVALITTASILGELLGGLGVETEMQKAMYVCAIGAGAAVVSHANDSGFWLITQLCNMDVKTGLKLYSLGTFIVGTFAAVVLWVMSFFLW